MTNPRTRESMSRRAALAGLSAAGAGLALTTAGVHAAAATATADLASHPLVGTWLSGPGANDLGFVHFAADGNLALTGGVAGVNPDGSAAYFDPPMGVWEPVGGSGAHVTFAWANRDATGKMTGTVTVDAYPVADADGESFWDDGTRGVVTLRGPDGVVTDTIKTVPKTAGVRVRPGKPGYEAVLAILASPPAATPESGTPTT